MTLHDDNPRGRIRLSRTRGGEELGHPWIYAGYVEEVSGELGFFYFKLHRLLFVFYFIFELLFFKHCNFQIKFSFVNIFFRSSAGFV